MSVELILVQADGQMRTAALSPGRHVIGRGKEADVRVAVDIVSREHCEIVVDDAGVHLRDLGSSNGTYVNCQRIDEHDLAPGDLVAVGPAVFVARIDGEPEEIDPYDAYEDGIPSIATPSAEADADGETASGSPGPSITAPPENEDSSLVDFDFSDLDDDDQPSL